MTSEVADDYCSVLTGEAMCVGRRARCFASHAAVHESQPLTHALRLLVSPAAGTSMAAPYVSGAAALAIAASGGTLTNAQVG